MNDVQIHPEETFEFPQYVALRSSLLVAYALGRVRQIHDTRVVPVRLGLGHLDRAVVYEHKVDVPKHAAVLLRSAWLRPVGSVDDMRPLMIQVLVDGEVILDQEIGEHLRTGYPFPICPCPCNQWGKGVECKCPVRPLTVGPLSPIYLAVALDDDRRQALPDRPYGLFAPRDTLIQIRVVKPGRGAEEFQARCGITAALYSTATKDIPA